MSERKRNTLLFLVWAFLMWLGIEAIDLAQEKGSSSAAGILGLYVLVTSFSVITLLNRLWGGEA